MATFVLACFYALRVYLHGYCVVTFFMGIALSIVVCFFLSSRVDPDLLVSSDAPSILPTKASDELRPFDPALPEFNFWYVHLFVLWTSVYFGNSRVSVTGFSHHIACT
ncbi:protein rer1a [Phtheirospermum japonicum]|uniref:Protein rer1a n=1 Tax=Phtheirospermum japonicum TaxID=374723 RepID=A0A830BLI0_9LAMI|nr:protein rer1a [Phtheirospermum japonicum]